MSEGDPYGFNVNKLTDIPVSIPKLFEYLFLNETNHFACKVIT